MCRSTSSACLRRCDRDHGAASARVRYAAAKGRPVRPYRKSGPDADPAARRNETARARYAAKQATVMEEAAAVVIVAVDNQLATVLTDLMSPSVRNERLQSDGLSRKVHSDPGDADFG